MIQDPQSYYTRLCEALRTQEDLYNLILGIVQRQLSHRDAETLMAVVPFELNDAQSDAHTSAELFVVRSARRPLVLAGALSPAFLSQGVPALLDFCRAQELWPESVVAPRELAQSFAQAREARFGESWRVRMAQGVFRLERVSPPAPCPGHFRRALPADAERLSHWKQAFVRESLPQEVQPLTAYRAAVEAQIQEQRLFVWEHAGRMVSMAGRVRETPHGTAVSLVYTPQELRGRGYATACVAALSQYLLDSGREFCCLFTDLSNPTSNKIYQRIGYQRVGEFAHYERLSA